jgi:hypothetical protein
MYNGIGLRTVRGSGTAGYVNGNKAYVRPSQVRKVVGMNTGTNVSARAWLARAQVCSSHTTRFYDMHDVEGMHLEINHCRRWFFLTCSPAHVPAL